MCKIFRKSLEKKMSLLLLIIVIFITIDTSPQLTHAWTEPTLTAPNGNLAAPINVGLTTQTKTGVLYVNGGVVAPLIWDTNNALYYIDPDGTSRMHYGQFDSLASSGAIMATSFLYFSDRNLKQGIEPLNNSLSKILQLQGVHFHWKDPSSAQKLNIGLIAQDVEKVYPELVATNKETGLKSVEYGNLIAPLIEAVKEQQKQIDELKKEIEQLKK